MLHRSASLIVAVAACLLAAAAPAGAVGRTAVTEIDGEFRAGAFSGDAVVLARADAQGGGAAVELHAPGRAPLTLLRLRGDAANSSMRIAASSQAVAVSLDGGNDDRASSRVLIGPPAGPLREVAGCAGAFTAPPVAVDGTRVAWAEGGCVDPVGKTPEIGEGFVAVGDVDPAVPVRRWAVPEERLATGLALGASSAVAGLLRPSLTSFYGGELRRTDGERLGPVLAGASGVLVEPVGVLAGDVTVAVRNGFLRDVGEDVEEPACEVDVIAIPPPGAPAAPPARLLRCLADEESETGYGDDDFYFASPGDAAYAAVTTGDRVVARTSGTREHRVPFGNDGFVPATLRSAAADGSGRRVVARGTPYRGPREVIGGSGRVGWVQARCVGGLQIRALDPYAAPGTSKLIRNCRADLLTRRARLRGGAVRLRLRCPDGCKGRVVDQSICTGETSRAFRFGRGVHTVRLSLTRRSRRTGRALVQVRVEAGRDYRRRVKVVRRGG